MTLPMHTLCLVAMNTLELLTELVKKHCLPSASIPSAGVERGVITRDLVVDHPSILYHADGNEARYLENITAFSKWSLFLGVMDAYWFLCHPFRLTKEAGKIFQLFQGLLCPLFPTGPPTVLDTPFHDNHKPPDSQANLMGLASLVH